MDQQRIVPAPFGMLPEHALTDVVVRVPGETDVEFRGRVLAAAPPLTPEQRATIRAAFGWPRPGR